MSPDRPVAIAALIIGSLFLGMLIGESRTPLCADKPGFRETVERDGQTQCVYVVQYIRPMHRNFPRLTEKEKLMFEKEKS